MPTSKLKSLWDWWAAHWSCISCLIIGRRDNMLIDQFQNHSGRHWTIKLGRQTVRRNKSFHSLVFVLTQLHFGQCSSRPFCLPCMIVSSPRECFTLTWFTIFYMVVKQDFGQLAWWCHNALRPAIVKVLYSSGSLRVDSSNSSSLCSYPHQLLSVDTMHCFTRYADADQH